MIRHGRVVLLRNILAQPRRRQTPMRPNCGYDDCGVLQRTWSGVTTRQWFSSSSSSLSSQPTPIVELREDTLYPQHASTYVQNIRKQQQPEQLRFISMPQTGGKLQKATLAYFYEGGLEELVRNQTNTTLKSDGEDSNLLSNENRNLLACIQSQESNIYVEAPLVQSMSDEIRGLSGNEISIINKNQIDGKEDGILELRHYYLKLGYDTVPKFLELYSQGLPSKLHAPNNDPSTQLVTLLYSEIGRLNEVVEIWKHGSIGGMNQTRIAARAASEWRQSISQIADLAIEFHTTIHKPI